jgi:hypothetical protein
MGGKPPTAAVFENRKWKLEKRKAPAAVPSTPLGAGGGPYKRAEEHSDESLWHEGREKSRFLTPFKRRTGFGMTNFEAFWKITKPGSKFSNSFAAVRGDGLHS